MIRCLNCMKTFDEQFGVCPHCGFMPGTPPKEAYHLYPGTVLNGHYIIGTTVGFGGFGITYRAWDKVLDKMVAIKEFYPNGIVNRVPGEKAVIIYSGNRADEFLNGKIRFLAEARNMARFNTHPNIVNVYEFFEENNTAYIAMEFLDGMSYKQYIAANNGRIDCQTAVNVVLSVTDALREIHKVKIIHRDISPDNIFMVPVEPGAANYKVKLIDFGAARFSSGEEEKTLSIILKPGYAPPEQYRSRSKQGPWTDIYAVGAVLYRSVTGRMPEESVNRVVEDHLPPPNALVPEIPQYLSDTIMRAMALSQELRFQNVDQFQAALRNQTRVRDVQAELKRRKKIRGISIALIILGLSGAGLGCRMIYVGKQKALYNVQANVSLLMPDVNGAKEEEVKAAGALGAKDGEARQIELEDSREMADRMLEEYETNFQKVELDSQIYDSVEEYPEFLAESLEEGNPPFVFETSGITAEDKEIWDQMGTLDTCYQMLDTKQYYFMDTKEFKDYFTAEKKQLPVSFCAPVLYVNIHMVDSSSLPEDFTSLEQLELDGELSVCVSARDRAMYRNAFDVSESEEAFQPAAAGEKGYEPFLKREAAYYLGSTEDYEAIRAGLGGIYQMTVLETLQRNGAVKGRFTHLWSIHSNLKGDDKKAADSLVYYLAGESAQDVFNLQAGNGLSLNKNMLETYVQGNDEFQQIAESLEFLTMEYGEVPES
ncbi:MAG: serine/threonine protein kinase [Lachnospiraceae bacterium]|jgi:serine/threonine protein kinase|nr:serine/threonine protein kinase [Lachnospiraceae bacterium]